jgi:NitT/TauT family transport system substrate-binding protein
LNLFWGIGITSGLLLLVWFVGYVIPNDFSDELISNVSHNVGTMRIADDPMSPLEDPIPIRFVWTKYIENSDGNVIDVSTNYRYSNILTGEVLWEMSFDESFTSFSKEYVDKDGHFMFPPNLQQKSYSVYNVGGSILENDFVKEHEMHGLTVYEFFGETVLDVTDLYPDYGVPVFEEYKARTFVEQKTGVEIKFEESFRDYVILDEKKIILLEADTSTAEKASQIRINLVKEYLNYEFESYILIPGIIISSAAAFSIAIYLRNSFSSNIQSWVILLPSIIIVIFAASVIVDEPKTITIGLSDWPGYYTLFVAEDKGFFKENGVDVELVYSPDYEDSISKFKNKNVDGVMIVTSDILGHQDEGIFSEVVWVSNISLEGDAVLVKDESSVEKLKSANCSETNFQTCEYVVGVTSIDSFSHLLILDYLSSINVNPDDVLIKTVVNTETTSALESGDILLGHTWEPYVKESTDLNHQIVFTPAMSDYSIVDGLIFESDFMRNNSHDVRKIVKSLNQALDFVDENPQEAFEIMSKYSKVPADDLKIFYESIKIPTSREQLELLEESEYSLERAYLLSTEETYHILSKYSIERFIHDDIKIIQLVNYNFGALK